MNYLIKGIYHVSESQADELVASSFKDHVRREIGTGYNRPCQLVFSGLETV